MDLHTLGWSSFFAAQVAGDDNQDLTPARVIQQHRDRWVVQNADGTSSARISGRFRHQVDSNGTFPAVGDWVLVHGESGTDWVMIDRVLTRRSSFSRQAAGPSDRAIEQVVAANIDIVFLVAGLDGNFNLRRLERYLTVAWDSGATPQIVLNKTDLCDNVQGCIDQVEKVAPAVTIHAVSAASCDNIESIRAAIPSGRTAAFLGSSGVGKSSLINALLGEERQSVAEVSSEGSRGRHTTTSRELILLPEGGIVIDTPGMRELQIWADEASLGRTFEDIERVAQYCRFADCSHLHEPGCAVRAAIESGELEESRFDSYRKQLREIRFQRRRQDTTAARAEQEKWKKITKRWRNRHKELY
jgi:ribosome biogenesis GTPase